LPLYFRKRLLFFVFSFNFCLPVLISGEKTRAN
jgi:hypothetical protein